MYTAKLYEASYAKKDKWGFPTSFRWCAGEYDIRTRTFHAERDSNGKIDWHKLTYLESQRKELSETRAVSEPRTCIVHYSHLVNDGLRVKKYVIKNNIKYVLMEVHGVK